MRRVSRIIGLVVVGMFLLGGKGIAGDHAYTITAAATNYGLDLPGPVYCSAVYAWDADIGIEFVLNGVEVDSCGLARGTAGQFTVHCDSLNIVRASSTKVSILLGYPDGPCPSFAGSNAVAYASAPIPVTVYDPAELWGYTNFTRTGGSTSVTQKKKRLPVEGFDVHGAQSILLMADWTYFTGNFSIRLLYNTVGGDTFVTCPIDSGMYAPNTVYARWNADSTYTSTTTYTNIGPSPNQNFWRVDSTAVKQSTGNESFVVRIHNNGHLFAGYLYAEIDVPGGTDLRGFRLLAVREY